MEQTLSEKHGSALQTRTSQTSNPLDFSALQATWQAFDALAHLHPICSDADYDRMVNMLNALLDVTGDDGNHPLSGLLELVADLVSCYEQKHYAIEMLNPKDALRFLMEARSVTHEDLSAIVPQRNLVAILAGKRRISADMAGGLGGFFGVSPAVFLPTQKDLGVSDV